MQAPSVYLFIYSLKLGGKGVAVEDRARHVIQYAIEARTALIKLLALLKWKNQADVEQVLPNGEKQGRVSLAFVSQSPVFSVSLSPDRFLAGTRSMARPTKRSQPRSEKPARGLGGRSQTIPVRNDTNRKRMAEFWS